MKWLMDMKIAAKLITGFVIVAIIATTIGVVGTLNMKALEESNTELYENMTVPISILADISTQFQRSRVNIRDMILSNDSVVIKDTVDKMTLRQADIAKDLEAYDKTISTSTDRTRGLFDDLDKKYTAFAQQNANVFELAKQNKDAEAIAAMSETGPAGIASRALQDAIANVTKVKEEEAKMKSDSNTKQAHSTMVSMIIIILAGSLIAIGLGVLLSSIINKPIKLLTEAANKLAVGNVDFEVSTKRKTKDELGTLMGSFEKMVENIRALLTETDRLVVATQEGKLDTRGNTKAFAGGWGTLVGGVNNLIDAFVGPINVTAEYVDRISKGDIPPKITDTYNGDFNEIKNNLNNCIDTMSGLLTETDKLIVATKEGKLDTRGNAKAFSGGWGTLVGGVNDLIEAFVEPINVTAEYVDRISKGDIPPEITKTYKGDFNEIKKNLNNCIDTMNGLLMETEKLVVATQEGKLDTRGNDKAFAGGWGTLVGGVNNLIDAFVGPINVTAEYVNRISKGDIPPKITDNYNGDFNEIKNNLNNCIDTMSGLLTETDKLIVATQEGKLNTRGNDKAFAGGWGILVGGINNLIEAFVEPINVTAEYVDRISKGDIPPKITNTYKGDFNEIKKNLNNCIDAVNALVTDANMLEKAAADGKLDSRADASKHFGDYARIIDGVNKTLDAVIAPVMEASAVLEEMARGNLSISIKGEYKGDHAKIKNALNDTITSLNEVLSDMNNASGQVASGARQVSDSAQALAQGSTEQASSVEELTAAMEEISTQTELNATNATQANELAVAAMAGAVKGNEQMKGMLKAMDDINESSGNISKIIKVIDEIAFQTNILALNAAVEAARAGQHGKGFAVVAEEVRNLAARSANAAKETTALIEGSIRKVEEGTKIANDTALALNQIVEGVTKATNLVGEIAVASNEQALGINQVNQGIMQVSDVVQTNSATSEESASASEELSSQAELLREQVSRFKLKKVAGSYKGLGDLNPEVLRMLEDMSQKKQEIYRSMNQGYTEAAATSSKPKISLSDREFGKY